MDLFEDDYPFPVLRPIHSTVNTASGRFVHFLKNWKIITQDNWVLQTVVGYKIAFVAPQLASGEKVMTKKLNKFVCLSEFSQACGPFLIRNVEVVNSCC